GGTVTLEVSLLSRLIVTGEEAGVGRLTANATAWPRLTAKLAGTPIVWNCTVTLAVASGTFGSALPRITVEPAATPVTGTVALLGPAGIVTDVGTVAIPVLSTLSAIVTGTGVTADKLTVAIWVPVPVIVMLGGEKVIVPVTWTEAVPDAYPLAEAVMLPL